jgi:pyruvate/2-oxoglutarate/acetoin dehydrogenase E1 component
VIDLRTVDPLDDLAFMNSVKKTGRLIIVQNPGGIAVSSEVAARVSESCLDYLDAPIVTRHGWDVDSIQPPGSASPPG